MIARVFNKSNVVPFKYSMDIRNKYIHNLEFLYVLTATMGKDETKILSPRESAKLIAEHSEGVKIHTEGVDKIAKHVRNVS